MGQNEDLAEIVANQAEAQSELGGLPAKIDELIAQVEAGQPVDPALLAAAKAGSAALANIVPNQPAPEPEPPVVEESPPVDVPAETPAEETPADAAPAVDEPTA